ncbi:MAG: CHAT domain-containing protein, partial [Candidatus Eisenbacteria bacterium]|nr:CHAT domain-containing protein [Candidatus Eisenbacteria bacterium]
AGARLSCAAATASARPAPHTRVLFARFDSLAAHASADDVGRWVGGPECGASADTSARAVAAALRARQFLAAARYASCAAQANAAIAHARATRDTLLECRALYALGMAHALSGDVAPAPAHARRLVALARRAHLKRDEAHGRLTLAYLDVLAERYPAAERGYRAALRGLSPEWDAGLRRIARVGLSRALFNQGRTREARALDVEIIRESRAAGDVVQEAIALNNLATHDLIAGDPAEAIPNWARALRLQRAGARTQDAVTTALNLAGALARLGRYDEVGELLEEYADSTRTPLRAWQRAEVLAVLASARSRQDRDAEADRLAKRAWDLALSARVRPALALLGTRAELATNRGDTGGALALVDEWLGSGAGDPLDRDDALMARSIAAMQALRGGRPAEALERWHALSADVDTSDALGRMKRSHVLLGEALAHFRLGHRALGREAAHAALCAWESGRGAFRSAQWRELLERDGVYLWGSVLAELRLAGGGASEAFDVAQRLKARTFTERMGGARAAPVTLASLRTRVLRPGEVAFDAFPGLDSLLVFVVANRELRAYTVPERAGRGARCATRGALAGALEDAPELRASAARELSRELLAPAAAAAGSARQWIVTADGVTGALPWDDLPLPGGTRTLGASRAVANVPSLTALARLRERTARSPRPGPFVLAGITGPGGRELAGAREEAEFLRARYASADVRVPRTGADVRAALERMRGAAVVHVAAHFTADPENPWRSGVLLGPVARDESWLRAADVAGRVPGTALVVLAGCGSAAVGEPDVRGERGLATAFLAAGARSAVGAIGPVEDRASVEFARAFYAGLDGGLAVSEALARARGEMRTSSRAPFVLFGDPDVRVRLPRRRGLALPALDRLLR